jgi:hypothetical protein
VELPGEGHARDGRAGLFCYSTQRAEYARQALHVDRWEVEGGAARVGGAFLVRIELAREQAASERAPKQNGEPSRLAHRRELALDVATGNGVVDLRALEAGEAILLGKCKRV